MLLGFVVPLRSKALSADWDRTCRLCERTLRSLCAVGGVDFKVVVVCHDRPAVGLAHPAVEYVSVDFPLVLSDGDRREDPENARRVIAYTDKGRKLLLGMDLLVRQWKADYVMMMDADDCVSARLGEAVAARPAEHGWFLPRGYQYYEGSRWVYLKRRNFHMECGSTFIFRSRDLDLPASPEYDRGYDYYRFYLNHAYIVDKMRKAGRPMTAMRLPGVLYVIHGEQITTADRLHKRALRAGLKWLLNARRVDDGFRREFGLSALSSLGAAEGGVAP